MPMSRGPTGPSRCVRGFGVSSIRYTQLLGATASPAYTPSPDKTQEKSTRMWSEVRALLGEGSAKGRLVAVDFGRAPINAHTATFPQSGVTGRYFRLGQSRYRKALSHGISPKYMDA